MNPVRCLLSNGGKINSFKYKRFVFNNHKKICENLCESAAKGKTMHPYKRSARVKDLIRKEVADIIMHKLKDPRLGFITVTEAEVSDDLRHARVYISVLEDTKKDETLKILISSAKFIRSELSKRVKIKFIPELAFKLDKSIEYGAKIDKILNEIKLSADPSENHENSA